MSNNPYFSPDVSTDSVYRGQDTTRCLSDDLDTIEEDLAGLEAGKAASDHIHTGYAAVDHTHTPAAIGAAPNDHTHNYAAASHSHAQTDITGLAGSLGSKADLVDGKVPESQLPSYVDDVVEYANLSAFPTAGESGKVYVALDTNKTYRWSGSSYVEISASLALGETSATAYRGDRGKTAYDHSQNGDVHVTAAQKTAWDSKAAGDHTHTPAGIGAATAGHNHDDDYVAKALQMVSDNGNVEYEMAGLDILATIEGMPTGMHTGYCPVNSTNAPLSNEAWRFLVHKTGVTYGWVLAFGSYGSVYSGYLNAGTWRGWKCLVDGTSAPLWKHESDGGFYMTANQTVTPSKPLDKCRNGWLLMWSDYDPDTSTTNNADICTTMIPKRGPTGALWSGQGFLCPVATWMDDATDTDVMHIKKVYVHNTKLVGFAGNNLTDRRDVVLRAVYEY